MQIAMDMTLFEKLTILSDAAKYDVACTSSGVDRSGNKTGMGNCLHRASATLFLLTDAVSPS